MSAERDFTYRALLLAVLVEVVSCAGIFGDSFSRPTAEALSDWHVALNLPVYFLLYLLRVGPVLQIQNGCLRLDNPVSLGIIAAQCCVWTWLFAALMQLEQRLRAWFSH